MVFQFIWNRDFLSHVPYPVTLRILIYFSDTLFFFSYLYHCQSLPILSDSNIDEVFSINLCSKVFNFGDFNGHYKDWLNFPEELIELMKLSFSTNLEQPYSDVHFCYSNLRLWFAQSCPIRDQLSFIIGFWLSVLLLYIKEISSFICINRIKGKRKGKFRQASNCCKTFLEAAELAYDNKTKESVTLPKTLAFGTFRRFVKTVHNRESDITPLFNGS